MNKHKQDQNYSAPEVTRVDKSGRVLPKGIPFGIKSIGSNKANKSEESKSKEQLLLEQQAQERTSHLLGEIEVIMRENNVSIEEANHLFQFFINFYSEKARKEFIFTHNTKSLKVKGGLQKMREKIKSYAKNKTTT